MYINYVIICRPVYHTVFVRVRTSAHKSIGGSFNLVISTVIAKPPNLNIYYYTTIILLRYEYYIIAGITCPPLTLINGEIKFKKPNRPSPVSGEYLPPTIATHTCNYGYILKGQKYLECQATGKWNYDSPTCEGKASHELANILLVLWLQ